MASFLFLCDVHVCERREGCWWLCHVDASQLALAVDQTGLKLGDLPVSMSHVLGLSVGASMAMEVSQHPGPRLAVVAVLISQCFFCCRACGWNWLQTTRRWSGGLVHGLEAPFWHLWLVDKLLYRRGELRVGLIDVQQFRKRVLSSENTPSFYLNTLSRLVLTFCRGSRILLLVFILYW